MKYAQMKDLELYLFKKFFLRHKVSLMWLPGKNTHLKTSKNSHDRSHCKPPFSTGWCCDFFLLSLNFSEARRRVNNPYFHGLVKVKLWVVTLELEYISKKIELTISKHSHGFCPLPYSRGARFFNPKYKGSACEFLSSEGGQSRKGNLSVGNIEVNIQLITNLCKITELISLKL